MSDFHYPTIKFLGNDEVHEQGYLLLRCFETGLGTGVSLVYSLDDQRTYIRKLITPEHHYFPGLPAEVRYSNLADESPFPKVPFLAQNIEQFELNDDSWIVYTVAYNGGTHKQLLEKFESEKKAVPESFIWHYIEQCIRAYAYLHFGLVDGKRVGGNGKKWVPIVHRDGNEDNVIFHFPDPNDLSQKTEKDRKIAEAFPQVILVDLGMANRVDDPEGVRTFGKFDTPGVNQWEDVVLFGERLRELLYTSFGDTYPLLRDAAVTNLYSKALITAVEQFDGPPNTTWGADTAHHIPTWDWMMNGLLRIAIRKVREYKRKGNLESVMWAKPTPTANMPFHVNPTDKLGLRDLRKQGDYWEAVDFHFNSSGVTALDELPGCLEPDFDLRLYTQALMPPQPVEFVDKVKDAAKRLKRAAKQREKQHNDYGGTSELWANDIKAVRGILPILRQVYKDPDDSDTESSSSSEDGNDEDNSGAGDSGSEASSSGDSADGDPGDNAASGSSPANHPAAGSARHSNSPSPKPDSSTSLRPAKSPSPKAKSSARPLPADTFSTGDAGVKASTKRSRSRSVDPNARGKRRKALSGRPQVRETIVKNTYITRSRDLDENGM